MASRRTLSAALRLLSVARGEISSAPHGRLSSASPLVTTQGSRSMTTARQKFAWDTEMPSWMYGALQDPDRVFHELSEEDKHVLRLVQLMLKESLDKTKAMHQDSDAKNLVELKKLSVQLNSMSDKQRDIYMTLGVYMFIMGFTISATYKATNNLKAQSLELVNNLASNSEEIVADLVDAVKHGVDSKYLLGEGKPFVWKDKWLKKKETGVLPQDGVTTQDDNKK